jgi:hypothetical protein
LSRHDALRPAEADLVEIEIGMLRADMVKHASDRASDTRIEALCRIGVNVTPHVFLARVLNGAVSGEILAGGDKRFPLVTHQMGFGRDLFFKDPIGLALGKIGDNGGTGIARRRTNDNRVRPLYDDKCGRFQCFA